MQTVREFCLGLSVYTTRIVSLISKRPATYHTSSRCGLVHQGTRPTCCCSGCSQSTAWLRLALRPGWRDRRKATASWLSALLLACSVWSFVGRWTWDAGDDTEPVVVWWIALETESGFKAPHVLQFPTVRTILLSLWCRNNCLHSPSQRVQQQRLSLKLTYQCGHRRLHSPKG